MNDALELKPEQQAIVKQAEVISGKLSNFKIHNQAEYDVAGDYRRSIKTTYKQIEELRLSLTRPLDALKKRWQDFFAVPLDKLSNADHILEAGRLTYSREQEKIRFEAEEKLRKAAEAEEAKKRAIKEAQEQEWRKREEAARKEAERLAKAGKAEAAAKARAEADKAAKIAEERRQQAEEVQVIAPVLASTVNKTDGIGARKNWKFEIIDKSLIPRKYLIPDLVQIGKEVRAAGDTLSIPGIRIFSEDKEVVRTN
jgi:uncharacterized membrane protein YqiK